MRALGRFVVVAFAILAAAPPAFAAGASPIGRWEVTTGEARYSVVGCGGSLCAKLVWLRTDARTEENLALLNHYLVRGARPQGDGTWSVSLILKGNSYAGTMTMVSRNFMRLNACSGFICRTYEFTRL
jgi:uncharacterized protein (DUF2147 family)